MDKIKHPASLNAQAQRAPSTKMATSCGPRHRALAPGNQADDFVQARHLLGDGLFIDDAGCAPRVGLKHLAKSLKL
ncbi:hypothetical protein IWX85_000337 [Polaromonas sp. CG_9.11]|nr:hypothetical protein [Polaromonas sp. CG_9.11]MBG6074530.1 hypothetical protein [Polaromonas sp. CG_9.11]